MFKYLNYSECKSLEYGFKQILSINLLLSNPNLDCYYTGDLDIEKAINIYLKINSLDYCNREKFDDGSIIRGYLNKLFICSLDELEDFISNYNVKNLIELIMFKRIIEDSNCNLFFEGKLSLQDAMTFYKRIVDTKLLTKIFPTASKVMYGYMKHICKYDYNKLKDIYYDIPEYYCDEIEEQNIWEEEYGCEDCTENLIQSIENVVNTEVYNNDFYDLISTPKCFIDGINILNDVRNSIFNHMGIVDLFSTLTTGDLEDEDIIWNIGNNIGEEYNNAFNDSAFVIAIKDINIPNVDVIRIDNSFTSSCSIKSEIYNSDDNTYLTISGETSYSGISFISYMLIMIALIENK